MRCVRVVLRPCVVDVHDVVRCVLRAYVYVRLVICIGLRVLRALRALCGTLPKLRTACASSS